MNEDHAQGCGHCAAIIPAGLEVFCGECANNHDDCFTADDVSSARDGDGEADAAQKVFDWAERRRVLKGMPKETWELFQECVEDLRA
jgi:hypothetical protein